MPTSASEQGRRRAGLYRLLAVLSLVALVAVVLVAGGLDLVRDPEEIEEFLTGSGWVGPLVYVLAFVALQPLNLPGTLLIIPATLVWPGWTVFALSVAGGLVASLAGFAFARWLARDWVQDRLSGRFLVWEQRISDRGLAAVIVLRLITGYAPAADWVLGVSTVTLRQFVVGTVIGLIPGTFAVSFLGDDALRLLDRAPYLIVVLLAVAGVGWLVVRRLRREPQPEPPPPSTEKSGSGGGPPS